MVTIYIYNMIELGYFHIYIYIKNMIYMICNYMTMVTFTTYDPWDEHSEWR